MADSPTKGAFQADIPADAVEEALRSVERIHGPGAAAAGEGAEVAMEPAAEEAAESEREKSLSAQLELSQVKARETLEQLKDTHDRYLRAVAELENYRKRAQKERDEVLRFGNEKILKDLFPIVDALDRALAAAAAAEEAGSACRRGEGEARAIDTPWSRAFSSSGPASSRPWAATASPASARWASPSIPASTRRSCKLPRRTSRPARWSWSTRAASS